MGGIAVDVRLNGNLHFFRVGAVLIQLNLIRINYVQFGIFLRVGVKRRASGRFGRRGRIFNAAVTRCASPHKGGEIATRKCTKR